MKKTKRGKAIAGIVIGLAGISLGAIGFSSWIIGATQLTDDAATTQVTVDETEMQGAFVSVDVTDGQIKVAENNAGQSTDYVHTGDNGADLTVTFTVSMVLGANVEPYPMGEAPASAEGSYDTITISWSEEAGDNVANLVDRNDITNNVTGYHWSGPEDDAHVAYYLALPEIYTFSVESTDKASEQGETPDGFVLYEKTISITFRWGDYFGTTYEGPTKFYNDKLAADTTTTSDATNLVNKLSDIKAEMDLMRTKLERQTLTLKATLSNADAA